MLTGLAVYGSIGLITTYISYRNCSRWYDDHLANEGGTSREIFDRYIMTQSSLYGLLWPIALYEEYRDRFITSSYNNLSLDNKMRVRRNLRIFRTRFYPDNQQN